VEATAEGFRLVWPLSDYRRQRWFLLLGLAASAAAVHLQIVAWMMSQFPALERQDHYAFFCWHLRRWLDNPADLTAWPRPGVWFCSALFLALALAGCDARQRQAQIDVAPHRLRIAIVGFFRPRCWTWERQHLQWIACWQGLYVTTGKERIHLFPKENHAELAWLAETLQQALSLQRVLQSRPGEIEIAWTSREYSPPNRGFLLAQPLRLAIRHDFLGTQSFEFFPAGAYYFFTAALMARANRYALTPDDIQCKLDDNGGACMRIAPSSWPGACVHIWCADSEALVAALARFWGQREVSQALPGRERQP